MQNTAVCVVCDSPAPHSCSSCSSISYCSRPCQKSDWAAHKLLCPTLKKRYFAANQQVEKLKVKLKELEETRGVDDELTLNTVSDIGKVLRMQESKQKETKACYLRVLSGRERTDGPLHDSTLEAIQDICSVMLEQHDFPAAATYARRFYAGHQQVRGPKHEQTLTAANNLGAGAHVHAGDDAGRGAPLSARARRLRRDFGPHAHHLARVSSQLGRIFSVSLAGRQNGGAALAPRLQRVFEHARE